MISLQNDPGAILQKSYPIPLRGTWKTLPSHLLPDDVVQDSLNVSLIDGALRSRAGLRLLSQTLLDSPALGSFLFTGVTNSKTPLVASSTTIYALAGVTWLNVSPGVSLHTSLGNFSRFTSIQSGSYVYVLHCNGVDPLWSAQEAVQFAPVTPYAGSSIPILTDMCTVAGLIVGIVPPYTVTWCAGLSNTYLSFTNWPALNQVILADTEDSLVAIRPLGTLGFVCYKEGNIFVGSAQAGPLSAAFGFQHRGEFEGPGGVNAVVNWNGMHVYMTPSGRVGLFDGTNHQWILDGLWPFLRKDIDSSRASSIFGAYNYLTSEVYFWYPRLSAPDTVDGMVQINMPYPLAGIQDFSGFLGRSSFGVSNALSVRLFDGTLQPYVWRSDTYGTYVLDTDTYVDGTVDFPCSFTTGVFRPVSGTQQLPGGNDIFRGSYEVFATRDSIRGSADVQGLSANALETHGSPSAVERIDLTQTRPNEYISFPTAQGKFLGLSITWQSSSRMEYKGCDVYARRTG